MKKAHIWVKARIPGWACTFRNICPDAAAYQCDQFHSHDGICTEGRCRKHKPRRKR